MRNMGTEWRTGRFEKLGHRMVKRAILRNWKAEW
jgi:hypothetical protein